MRWKIFLVILSVLLTGEVFSQSVVPNTYVVKFRQSGTGYAALFQQIKKNFSSTPQVQSLSAAVQPSIQHFYNERPSSSAEFTERYAIVHLEKFVNKDSVLQSLKSDSSVESVQPSYIYKINSLPNDSAFFSQWNLNRIGITSLLAKGIINSSLPEVNVGVIDTGIDTAHADLINELAENAGETGTDANGLDKRYNGIDDDGNGFIDDWRGYDFVDGTTPGIGDWSARDNAPMDENGHGTSVAGIIAAESNNGIGIAGISSAKILALRAFDATGNGSDVDIASAIVYAVDNGAEIINMSFGDIVESPILRDAVAYAYSKNILLVASSGNDGSDNPHYPSDLNGVVSVGSVNSYDSRSVWSSHSSMLDLVAPGESIPTTALGGGYTGSFSGTSAAAPQVSGVLAVLKAYEKSLGKSADAFLSNEDYRGLLVTTADDVGDKGWDSYTAAGVVNAENAISSLKGSNVAILRPTVDEIVTANYPVVITAISPYFQSLELSIGIGESPTSWKIFYSSSKQHYNDTVSVLDVSSFESGSYVIRLKINNSKGNNVETKSRILVNSNLPKIASFDLVDSVVSGDEYISFVQAVTDVPTFGTLYYRKKGSSDSYRSLASENFGRMHNFLLTSALLEPDITYEFYTTFTENSNRKGTVTFPTVALTGIDRFEATLSSQKISTTSYSKISRTLPGGYLLNEMLTLSGKVTVILNEYTAERQFGKLKLFQLQNGQFVQKDSIDEQWIPKSFVRSENGTPWLLVQNYGSSAIFPIDTVNAKFLSPIWSDTSNMWGSQLVDLNGDGKPEIIARNSSEYLIYKNNGNNSFQLETTLPNPSQPLSGEANNQFGPPKTIVGDFTHSGVKEIAFADYDGDLLLYRQNSQNSLSFSLVEIDSSYLYDMSDYITAGDFNGDGITDIAVAGHSNLGENEFREYDAPYWDVRIFAHTSSDAAGKLSKKWEQIFFGANAGGDNGLSTGEVISASSANSSLVINFNPNIFVFSFDGQFSATPYWKETAVSNSAVVLGNVFGFNNGSETVFYQRGSGVSTLQAPWAVQAIPVSGSKIKITWNSAGGMQYLYRGTPSTSLTIIDSTNGNVFLDSTVTALQTYYYAVQMAPSGGNGESSLSEIVSTIPHEPATIISLKQATANQISLKLSFSVKSSSLQTAKLTVDETIESTSAMQGSSAGIIFTFAAPFSSGTHTARIQYLVDSSGLMVDTTQVVSFEAMESTDDIFFAHSIDLINPTEISIEFNEPLLPATANQIVNYSVSTNARTFPVERIDFDSTKPAVVFLHSSTALNQLMLRIEVQLSERLLSASGKKLNEGKGQTLSIAQTADNIDNVVAFPNPVRMNSSTAQQVTFVNMPANCQLSIYTVNGMKIKILSKRSTRDGVAWNLRDEREQLVASGVYIFRLEQLDDNGGTIKTKLGKISVIR
jgi:subtilisin family serine protease